MAWVCQSLYIVRIFEASPYKGKNGPLTRHDLNIFGLISKELLIYTFIVCFQRNAPVFNSVVWFILSDNPNIWPSKKCPSVLWKRLNYQWRVDMRVNRTGLSNNLSNKEVIRLCHMFVCVRGFPSQISYSKTRIKRSYCRIYTVSMSSIYNIFRWLSSINPSKHIRGFVQITQRLTSFENIQTKRLF